MLLIAVSISQIQPYQFVDLTGRRAGSIFVFITLLIPRTGNTNCSELGDFSEIYFPDSLGYYDFELDEFKSLSHECYSIYREGIGLYAEGSYIFETNHFYELQKFIRGTDHDTYHIVRNPLMIY